MAAAAIVAEENNVAALMVDYEVVVYDKGEVNDLLLQIAMRCWFIMMGWIQRHWLLCWLQNKNILDGVVADVLDASWGATFSRGLDIYPDLRRYHKSFDAIIYSIKEGKTPYSLDTNTIEGKSRHFAQILRT